MDEDTVVIIETSTKVLSHGRAIGVLKNKIGDLRNNEIPLNEN